MPPPSAPVTLLEALAAAPEGSALADASESLGSIQDDLDNLVMATFETTLTATGEPAWRGAVELFPGWESFSEEDAAESTARETAAQSAPP